MQNHNFDESGVRELLMDIFTTRLDMAVVKCRMDNTLSFIYGNDTFYSYTGYTDDEFRSVFHGSFMESVVTTDRLDFKQKIRKAVKQKSVIADELRIKRKDGKSVYVALKAEIGCDSAGVETFVAVLNDIGRQREMATQLRLQRMRYHVLQKITNEPVFEYDDLSDTMIITDNRSGEDDRIIHNYRSELKNSGYIHPDDVDQYIAEFDASLNQDTLSVHEFRTNLFSSSYLWYRAVYTNIYDEDSGMVKLIGKMENINEAKVHQLELLRQSMYDPMTRLYNRVTIKNQIEKKLHDDSDGVHALMIVDIDNFKMVNDNLGHLFGDTVLINFAEELRKIYSHGELLGRIGGDEFMVFVPDADKSQLDSMAEQTCRIFDRVYSGNLNEINVSTSVGISMFPSDGRKYQELFRCSDRALYYSKQQGKSQYHFYSDEFEDVLASSDENLMNHYKMENSREQRNNDEVRDMIEFAFHILTETRDIFSGVGMVLESLAKRLQLSGVMLLEERASDDNIESTFTWNSDRNWKSDKPAVTVDYREWLQLINALKNSPQLTSTTEEFQEYAPNVYRYLRDTEAGLAVLDGTAEGDEVPFIVVLTDKRSDRTFDSDEYNMIHVIVKIVASYLNQLRTNERVNKKIDRLTNYDAITGRYRLGKFKTELRKQLDRRMKEISGKIRYVIFYMDIDGFRSINDIYGYSVGDQILYELSQIIKKRDNYVMGCRDYSDHFISLAYFNEKDDIKTWVKSLEQDFTVSQQRFLRHSNQLITGAYVVDDVNMNVSQMIDNANLARKMVKEKHTETFGLYDDKLQSFVYKNQQIESNMEDALLHGEFKVFLQAKYDLKTEKIAAAEALTRWQQPDENYMFPDDFIPVFEKNGFITQVDFYVLEVVLKKLKERILEHQPNVSISINQSRYLLHDDHYVERIQHLIEKYDIPPQLLEFELTESLFFEDSQALIDIMHRLKQLGVTVSIDDFGSGFSSLNILKDVPADIIKIDKEFLNKKDQEKEGEIIIAKTIELARELHKKVVCEGVETQEQADFLKSVGCDMVQGYLYARPVPMDDFYAKLDSQPESDG